MLPASADAIEQRLDDDAVVLDVGGWIKTFPRADWVIDLMPYATRAPLEGGAVERFSAETWVERDICDHEPWPFTDGQFDFVTCSHVLEDVRDPVWVCSELNRVARAGYIEVPSRLEEQSWWINGEWVGWSHHHWLIDIAGDSIDFVFKPHSLHGTPAYYFPAPLGTVLTDAERVQPFMWEDGFSFRERIFYELEEFHEYLAGFVSRWQPELESRVPRSSRRLRLRR